MRAHIVLLLLLIMWPAHASNFEYISVGVQVCHHSETCDNGLDDDCDGAIDNGCTVPPQPPGENNGNAGGGGGFVPTAGSQPRLLFVEAHDIDVEENAVIGVGLANSGTPATYAVRVVLKRQGIIAQELEFQEITLSRDANTIVVFDSWIPRAPGQYVVLAQVWDAKRTRILAEKVTMLNVHGFFRFDIRIDSHITPVRSGGDQNFSLLLHNMGLVRDDLTLKYWAQDTNGRIIAAESFMLAIAPDEEQRVWLSLRLPADAAPGTYTLHATISFLTDQAETEARFEVVNGPAYRELVLQQLRMRIQDLNSALIEQQKKGFDTAIAQEMLLDAQERLAALTADERMLDDAAFDQASARIRQTLDDTQALSRPPAHQIPSDRIYVLVGTLAALLLLIGVLYNLVGTHASAAATALARRPPSIPKPKRAQGPKKGHR
jgi:hypothetical protein